MPTVLRRSPTPDHEKRFQEALAAQLGQYEEAEYGDGKIFGRAELEGGLRQKRSEPGENDQGDGPGHEGAGRGEKRAAPPRPRRAIWLPSMQVTTELASPGMFTRMEVVDPPYMEP